MVVHGKENYCKCLQLLLGNKGKIQVNVDVSIAKLLVTFPRKYMFLHKMLFLVENHKKKQIVCYQAKVWLMDTFDNYMQPSDKIVLSLNYFLN